MPSDTYDADTTNDATTRIDAVPFDLKDLEHSVLLNKQPYPVEATPSPRSAARTVQNRRDVRWIGLWT